MVMSEKGSHAFLPLCVKMLKIRPAQEALDAGGKEDRRPSPELKILKFKKKIKNNKKIK